MTQSSSTSVPNPIRIVAITGIIVCSSFLTALFTQLLQDDSTSVPTIHTESIQCAQVSVPTTGVDFDATGQVGKWVDVNTGSVLGWSDEEDSTIWNMRHCTTLPN